MKATPLAIPDVILVEPKVFGDERGFFFEILNQARLEKKSSSPRSSCNTITDVHTHGAPERLM